VNSLAEFLNMIVGLAGHAKGWLSVSAPAPRRYMPPGHEKRRSSFIDNSFEKRRESS
jgi:hypothetical protein